MAKQAINIGTTANDGTGDPIRDAFDKVNDNEDELYEGANITATAPLAKTTVADTSVTLAISDDGITATQLAVSGNGASGQVLTSQSDGTFAWATGIAGDVDSIIAGSGVSVNAATGNVTVTNTAQNATHTGEVTGGGALTITNDAVVTAKILDDNVTFAKLENRYTAKVDITTYTGAVSIDWAAGTTFKMGSSLTGAIEFDFTNFKQGQVITFYNLTGSETITFDSDAGTSETFNKVGAVDYAGGSTNMIQVECIDDSVNAIFNYSVAAYTSDATPS
tara:strand:+ start:17888 stop:18721 length:834 start_codon:yes stop_codon:yes gene_type:complete